MGKDFLHLILKISLYLHPINSRHDPLKNHEWKELTNLRNVKEETSTVFVSAWLPKMAVKFLLVDVLREERN